MDGIKSDIADFLMQPGNLNSKLRTIPAVFFSTGKFSLKLRKLLTVFFQRLRAFEDETV